MTEAPPADICRTCQTRLTPGAKFCHRCGTPAGTIAPVRPASGVGNALPWAVAAIALMALVALAAGQRFNRSRAPATAESPDPATPMGSPTRAPDISTLTPAERAERLYDRIMGAAERGRMDSVRFFLPMALDVYESLGNLTPDQRYDLGRLGEVGGDAALASAQADTILRENPQHLLGLVLALRAAKMRSDARAVTLYQQRLVRAEPAERRKQLPEYLLHQNDIDAALTQARGGR